MTENLRAEDLVPNVSVVVTTYNRVALLTETIDSILGQTYTQFEVIIIDNMSVDGTEEYIAGLEDPRIRYVRNENHGVIAVNRNMGIQMSKGKYVALCDDDDLWMADKLQLQVAIMEENPEIALCYTNAESFEGDHVIQNKMVQHVVESDFFAHLLRSNFIPNSSVVIRRSVFDKLGLLSVDTALFEDYEMWLRIAKEYPLYGIDKALIRYRLHSSNMAGSRSVSTLRAIRTIRGLNRKLDISWFRLQPYILFHFLKFCFYRVAGR